MNERVRVYLHGLASGAALCAFAYLLAEEPLMSLASGTLGMLLLALRPEASA